MAADKKEELPATGSAAEADHNAVDIGDGAEHVVIANGTTDPMHDAASADRLGSSDDAVASSGKEPQDGKGKSSRWPPKVHWRRRSKKGEKGSESEPEPAVKLKAASYFSLFRYATPSERLFILIGMGHTILVLIFAPQTVARATPVC